MQGIIVAKFLDGGEMDAFSTGLDMADPPDAETRQQHLDRAIQAAKANDIRTALEALYLGHILDGVFRQLRAKWFKLNEEDVFDAVAQAIVQLLEKAVSGETVTRPVAYLIKVANGFAYDMVISNDEISEKPVDETLEQGDTIGSVTNHPELKNQALSVARGLLPLLGQENVQAVMEYIFDAIERGVEDVSNEEIGQALGLAPDVVRQSKSRGWQRLARIAEEQGHHLKFSFLNSSLEED